MPSSGDTAQATPSSGSLNYDKQIAQGTGAYVYSTVLGYLLQGTYPQWSLQKADGSLPVWTDAAPTQNVSGASVGPVVVSLANLQTYNGTPWGQAVYIAVPSNMPLGQHRASVYIPPYNSEGGYIRDFGFTVIAAATTTPPDPPTNPPLTGWTGEINFDNIASDGFEILYPAVPTGVTSITFEYHVNRSTTWTTFAHPNAGNSAATLPFTGATAVTTYGFRLTLYDGTLTKTATGTVRTLAASGGNISGEPNGIGFTNIQTNSYGVVTFALPSNATGIALRWRLSSSSVWNTATAPSAGAGETTLPFTATPETSYVWRLQFTSGSTPYDTEAKITTPAVVNSGGGGDGSVPVPSTPNSPQVAKDCTNSAFIITEPTWPATTTSMELRRSATTGVGGTLNWTTIHTWTSAGGSYTDTDVTNFAYYIYEARALNSTGPSQWSQPNTQVILQSTTLTFTWLLPAEGSTLSNRYTLRFQIADTGEAIDPASTSLPPNAANLQLQIDGMAVPLDALTRVSGSKRNGIYSLLLDTRLYGNGARTLLLRATGTDGCPAQATRHITLNNTLRQGVLYLEPKLIGSPPGGLEYVGAEISLENEPLYPHPQRRYWTRHGVTSDASKVVDWGSLSLSVADKATAFDALQQITLGQGQASTTPDRTQYYATPTLSTPGQTVIWVQQWTPSQFAGGYETGCQYVAAITPLGDQDGNYLVFARNTNGTDARVWQLGGDTWTMLYDLADAPYSAPDASDVALAGNALYVVRPGEVFSIDLDTGEQSVNLAPRGETRGPRFVLTVGGEVLWYFVNNALSTAKTRLFRYQPGALVIVGELNDEVTHVFAHRGGAVLTACGTKLYSSPDTTLPTLAHTFGAAITALGAANEISTDGNEVEMLYVGLSNGQVWRSTGDNWTQIVSLTGPVGAVSAWAGAEDTVRGVAGSNSDHLTEELPNSGTSAAGQWSDARAIAPPAGEGGTVTRITALCPFVREISSPSGTLGQAGYVPGVYERKLLIGTGDSGWLVTLELTAQPLGALLASRVSHLNIDPIFGPKAVTG